MSRIIYLFGAGASHGALPIVYEIPTRIQSFIEFLENKENQLPDNGPLGLREVGGLGTPKQYQSELIGDLKYFAEEIKKHASIDTYAKKLYIQRDSEKLERLKISTSIFFIYEQIKNKPNERYDAFYASLIEKLNKFPDHIKILSWNYDFQFEKSYSMYSGNHNLEENQDMLNVWSFVSQNLSEEVINKFGIIKLNGSAQFPYEHKHLYGSTISFDNNTIDNTVLMQLISYYAVARKNRFTDAPSSYISFAWEHKSENMRFIETVKDAISSAEILVVIGYSFPFFNREIDRELFKSIIFKKIYIQDIHPEVPKERWLAIQGNIDEKNIILKRECGQFYLPNEL